LRLKPDYAEVHANLGNALSDQDSLEEAENSYRLALQYRPDCAEAFYNLGILFAKRGKVLEAIGYYRQAVALKPTYLDAHVNLGNALRLIGRMDEALASFQHALQLEPNCASAHWNRSIVLLARGDFIQGWPEYEWRWAQHKFARRHLPQPLWDGSDLNGKTILLHAEQGLGDTLHFLRYIPLVQRRGGHVVAECQPQLLSLLSGNVPVNLVARGSALPVFDVQAPLLSLPGIFRTGISTVPADIPYIHATPKLVEHWQHQMCCVRSAECGVDNGTSDNAPRTAHSAQVLRVGIAWQGNPGNPLDRHRSIPLACFARLAALPTVRLFSLQKGAGTEQLAAAPFAVTDYGRRFDEATGTLMDSAAIMINLDLVICSDTVVPHLAGALGIPVWIALALAPDWRWLLNREDSPWHPTIRLFRQRRFGDWDDVFDRITAELKRATDETRMKHG